MVKSFLYDRSGRMVNVSRHMPAQIVQETLPSFVLEKRKAIEASREEVQENVRSRSARLRVAGAE